MKYENIELTGSLDISGSFIAPYGTTSQRPSSPISGSLFYDTPANQTLVTASNAGSIAKSDITKEVWKRLYHNAPYLLKTKGTERGIKALMACYGLPSTILNIKEYGGSTPVTGLALKDVDPADFYKTFTYQKSSLALKTTAVVGTTDYMVRFPWKSNNIGGNTSKSVELRIKPVKGNEGVALSLGDSPTDGSGLQLKLEKKLTKIIQIVF